MTEKLLPKTSKNACKIPAEMPANACNNGRKNAAKTPTKMPLEMTKNFFNKKCTKMAIKWQ